jgi:hypothetical protein
VRTVISPNSGTGDSPSVIAFLLTRSFAMRTPGPTTRSTLALFQFLFRSPNATGSRHLLFGVFHPTDEFVAGEGRDVLPRVHRHRIGDECLSQVTR